MSAAYESAKRVALGLATRPKISVEDSPWNIPVPGSAVSAEMPFQYFERTIGDLGEIQRQRAALMLYEEEYAADLAAAEENLAALRALLTGGCKPELAAYLRARPLADWLSPVFLRPALLEETLLPALTAASADHRLAFQEAAEEQLKRLQKYQELLTVLLGLCRL